MLHQTGRSRRRRNSFVCRVVNNGIRLPLSVASATEQRKFKLLDSFVYSLIFLFILFSPQYGLFGHFVPSRSVNTYMQNKMGGVYRRQQELIFPRDLPTDKPNGQEDLTSTRVVLIFVTKSFN